MRNPRQPSSRSTLSVGVSSVLHTREICSSVLPTKHIPVLRSISDTSSILQTIKPSLILLFRISAQQKLLQHSQLALRLCPLFGNIYQAYCVSGYGGQHNVEGTGEHGLL